MKILRREYTEFEQNDLNAHPVMPSPRGSQWIPYIRHRLRMLQKGMATYATRKYARFGMDKYIEENRAMDYFVNQLTNKKPCLFYMGAVEISPNSPIRIKKHVRCPGTRRFVNSVKKKRNCVVRYVGEDYTSQTCPRCGTRYPQHTRSDRFKTCHHCIPEPAFELPQIIVTQKSRRQLKVERKAFKQANPNYREMNNRLVFN